MLLKISQNLQENTSTRVFLVSFCQIYKSTFLIECLSQCLSLLITKKQINRDNINAKYLVFHLLINYLYLVFIISYTENNYISTTRLTRKLDIRASLQHLW